MPLHPRGSVLSSELRGEGEGVEPGAFRGRVDAGLGDAAFDAVVAEVSRRCPVTQLPERAGTEGVSTWTDEVRVSAWRRERAAGADRERGRAGTSGPPLPLTRS